MSVQSRSNIQAFIAADRSSSARYVPLDEGFANTSCDIWQGCGPVESTTIKGAPREVADYRRCADAVGLVVKDPDLASNRRDPRPVANRRCVSSMDARIGPRKRRSVCRCPPKP